VPEAGTNAPLHHKFGIDMQKGAIVVVRPDSYVGAIVELSEDGWLGLNGESSFARRWVGVIADVCVQIILLGF
jgi:hypothetical protein